MADIPYIANSCNEQSEACRERPCIDMLTFLLNIFYVLFFLVTSTFFITVALVIKLFTFLFDKRLVWVHRWASVWASFYLWLLPGWKVEAAGRDKIDPSATYVVVSNHQSMVDIMLGYRLFFHFKWVAKAELLKVPFIGWNMMLNRYVFVKRGDRKSILDMMKEAETHLRSGSSVYIFPEGTRSETGEVGKFKSGAFTLAKRVGLPVLPIALSGSASTLPKGQYWLEGRHNMKVEALDPIPASEVAALSTKELADRARNAILEAMVPVVKG